MEDYIIKKTEMFPAILSKNLLVSRPHMIDPTNNYIYIPIWKNAGHYMVNTLDSLQWTILDNNTLWDLSDYQKNTKKIVFLRDPVERWVSGVTEYINLHHNKWNLYNNDLIELIFDMIILDGHTIPQVNFLHNLKISNCIFFKVDKNLHENFKHWLLSNHVTSYPKLYKNLTAPRQSNTTKGNPVKENVKNIMSSHLPKYESRIKEIYKKDYDLIAKVNFYDKG